MAAEMKAVDIEAPPQPKQHITTAESRGNYDVTEHMMTPEEVAAKFGTQVDFEHLGASKGLTAAQVAAAVATYGKNRLQPPPTVPEWLKFLKQFTNPLMMLLLVAGGLTYMAYAIQSPRDRNNLILASALIIVVSLTCAMSYLQERSANNVMASLKKMMPAKCTVMRDGQEVKVDAAELVPGDLVRLNIGDRVPADIRVLETYELKTECSSLTGESDLVPASVDRKHDLVAEARNVVFMSTLCMNGEGRGIVIRTGDTTMIGKIATLASDTTNQRSTLQVEVHRLVWFIGILSFITAIILFVIGLGRGMSPLTAFVNGFILVIVANVPEGLPATVTSCLALTAMRLRDRNVLIKRTDIIENLGVATIIASDKTGTLTQNRMTVENIWCNSELHKAATFQPPPPPPAASLARTSNLARISNMGRRSVQLAKASMGLAKKSMDPASQMTIGRTAIPRGDGTFEYRQSALGKKSVHNDAQATINTFSLQNFNDLHTVSWENSSALTRLVTIATVCNKAKFTYDKPQGSTAVPMFKSADDRKILGDATDSGLLRYADRLAPSAIVRMAYKAIFEIPFNSANKWALTVTECPGVPNQHLVMMKGAPEIVLTKCSHHYQNRQAKPIDDEFKANMTAAYERCGFMGERVIGFAYQTIPSSTVESYRTEEGAPPTSGLTFMGLVSLVDPPREGVLEAVNKCRHAGIRVAMVTGDHPLTAEAIARKVGIVTLPTVREIAHEDGVEEKDIAPDDERVGAVVVTGAQIRELKTIEEWDDILLKHEIVFARTSPQQKLQIVENLQRLGEVVAVTGDGVNDSPALKKAQIGVAMGLGGSDVARDAADIVLLDDQFPSIVNAIEEGRVIYDNLKKTIGYTLAHAVPEVWPLFLNLVLKFPLAISGLMILSIDLVTEQGPAISLAYEHAESNVMEREPRDLKKDRLIDGPLLRYSYLIAGMAEALACTIAFFTIFWWYDVPLSLVYNHDDNYWANADTNLTWDGKTLTPDEQLNIYYQAVSAYYVTLITCQFWHIWNCKTRQVSILKHGAFKNPITIFGAVISVAVMVIIVYAPFLQGIFSSGTLIGIGWVPQLMFLLFIFTYMELSKRKARRAPESWWSRHMAW